MAVIPRGKKPKEREGEDNIAYFIPNQRVTWFGKPGSIHSVCVKIYPYTIGYRVMLDSQKDRSYPKVINAHVDEIEPFDRIYYRASFAPLANIEDMPVIQGCTVKFVDPLPVVGETVECWAKVPPYKFVVTKRTLRADGTLFIWGGEEPYPLDFCLRTGV